ncbi:hypothetical protein [Streptomyces sp. NBC_00091]|uniref:hypothetical protein n=1 Tax=Streptomyces sp. NBC_00091 TaxID=2975648 RepID=UPI0022541E80|nr:hypothetical protein [Streptomyces sp. NBC_00091]MCX5376587.1 hypothetical protein [Streptomyces sp. NBC_00091]
MSRPSYEDHGSGDPAAVPAALGLGLLSVGGWLLTTTRPWQKPGNPLTLGIGWTVSGALLLSGLVLLARCVRTVHAGQDAPEAAEQDPGQP